MKLTPEKLKHTGEKPQGSYLFATNLAFNAKNSRSLNRMLQIVNFCESNNIEIGQKVGTGWDDTGMIYYQFSIPMSLIPNFVANVNSIPDMLNFQLPDAPLDNVLVELDNLYIQFYNELNDIKE